MFYKCVFITIYYDHSGFFSVPLVSFAFFADIFPSSVCLAQDVQDDKILGALFL
jgi:hypothetical protein